MDITKVGDAFSELVNWVRNGFVAENTRLDSQSTLLSQLAQNKLSVIVGRFVGSDQELQDTINAAPDQSVVFNSWYRFSHGTNGLFPSAPDEIQDWSFDATTGQIQNTTNSTTNIGVVSQEKYDSYILDVKLSSTNNDDDDIGVLLAFYKDPDTGREYTLEALRSPGGDVNLWDIVYNSNQGSANGQKMVRPGKNFVTWGNNQPGTLSKTDAGKGDNDPGWGNMAAFQNNGTDGSTRIYAVRDGDLINVTTSQWTTPGTLDTSTTLTIDLSTDPDLLKFRGPSPYGFVSTSQVGSTWTVNSFTNPKDVIYDLKTGKVYENQNGSWIETTSVSISDLGTDTLLVNPDTGKVFFMKDPSTISVMAAEKIA
uniref:Tail fiber protein n=1 Tax=Burkholderia phage vB_BgluM-SURPRISE13 TaxID=3159457 RepID=A0AAU7PF40_9VIRU